LLMKLSGHELAEVLIQALVTFGRGSSVFLVASVSSGMAQLPVWTHGMSDQLSGGASGRSNGSMRSGSHCSQPRGGLK
jgi:hypothetical protein